MKNPTTIRSLLGTPGRDKVILSTLFFVASIGVSTGFVHPTRPIQLTATTTTTNEPLWSGTVLFASDVALDNDKTVTKVNQQRLSNGDVQNTKPSSTLSSSSSSSSSSSHELDDCFPGRDENSRFECHESVTIWRDFQTTGPAPIEENIRAMADVTSRIASVGGMNGGTYFAKHIARSAYFVSNAILGNAAYQLHEQLVARRRTDQSSETVSTATATATTTTANTASRGSLPLLPLGMSGEIATRIILEALMSYEQDYEWIQKGVYREPWDMVLGHRQSNVANVVTQTGRFMRETIQVLSKRNRATFQDKQVAFFGKDGSISRTSALYPKYYQNAFHYQTDGWMSSESANVYETSTETLFLGRQDSMQRTSLPPIVELAKSVQSSGETLRVLEVACGTGRFMTFVRDNLPLDAAYTAVDLSPFYLEKARDNDNYWRKSRGRQEEEGQQSNSSPQNTRTKIAPATLVQAQAEELPFEDGSFDAVVCVYLFHELPREVRAKVAAEMARVVTPGGTVVLTDSIQRGDRSGLDASLGNFEGFNEPYYRDYIADDLGLHFERHGLKPMTKITRSTTKSLSFLKPN